MAKKLKFALLFALCLSVLRIDSGINSALAADPDLLFGPQDGPAFTWPAGVLPQPVQPNQTSGTGSGSFADLAVRSGMTEMQFSFTTRDFPNYNLAQMRAINPNFSMVSGMASGINGIIWLKQNHFSRSSSGGVERESLWVILGRDGLDSKWLTWNIPSPAGGSTEIAEASVYSFSTLARLAEIKPVLDTNASLQTIDFSQVTKNLEQEFILVLAWREHMPRELAFEDLVWFQEELPVWEAVAEVRLPQGGGEQIFWWSRPSDDPDIDRGVHEINYTWRAMNLDPLQPDSLTNDQAQRAGIAFSMRKEDAGLTVMMRDMENMLVPTMPDGAVSAVKKSGAPGLLSWLYKQPEIILTEGMSREIPEVGPWSRWEKIIMARKWLNLRGIDAALRWRLPMEPSSAVTVPLCHELLQDILLEITDTKSKNNSSAYYDLREMPRSGSTPSALAGVRIFGVAENGRLIKKQVPGTSAESNRLSAIMRLNMNDQGMLSGEIRLMLRGAWATFLSLPLDDNPTDEQMRAALLKLFPGLTNYSAVKYRKAKGVPELSFTLQNKPGVRAAGGDNMLLLPPTFEPLALRALVQGATDQTELRFPFVLDQDWEIAMSKNVDRVLVSGKINRNPGRINYSEEYKMRRNRLNATSRLEVGLDRLSNDDINTLRQSFERWRAFSNKQLPVQIKKR